jgi:hypothetical protein
VLSQGFGRTDAPVLPVTSGAGALTGGEIPALAYAAQTRTWGTPGVAPRADMLVVKATGISAVTVDATRARVSCHATLRVTTSRPLTVTLCGTSRTYR